MPEFGNELLFPYSTLSVVMIHLKYIMCAMLAVAVYCAAGAFIVTDMQNNSYCDGCPKHTYKIETDYYADSCVTCPTDRPRTMIVNATTQDACRLGTYNYHISCYFLYLSKFTGIFLLTKKPV